MDATNNLPETPGARGSAVDPDATTTDPQVDLGPPGPPATPRPSPATRGGRPAPGVGAKPKIDLSPGWDERVEAAGRDRGVPPEPTRIIPRAPELYAGGLTYVQDAAGAGAMLDLARQRPVAFVGIDCEYRFSRRMVAIKKGRSWSDPRSCVPLLMSVALAEVGADGGGTLYRFVVDLRKPAVLPPLAELLRQPVTFVAHFLRAALICLWTLGLPTPTMAWDTCTAERAFRLGLHHARYRSTAIDDDSESEGSREEAEEDVDFSCSLVSTCQRRGVPHPFAASKDRLQKSFLDHLDDMPFSAEQLEYAAADAVAAARLYPIQVRQALVQNALKHLMDVEMPWAVTNASMVWEGVRVDPGLCRDVTDACARHAAELSGRLAEMGVGNAGSHPDLEAFFGTIGLLDAFRKQGGYTFDDGHLGAAEGRHPAIPLIRALRKIKRLGSDRLLGGELVGADGRLHPDHRQLGTDSGRNSMRDPNVGGIGKALRPLVVPSDPAGWAIGEVDLSQIEVLIAAAETGDADLIAMVNGRDVYCAMARSYYADEMSAEERALPDDGFAERFRARRDRMKVFTLATMYNITPFGLARQLGISPLRAAGERDRFLAMFPVMGRAMREASAYGAIRGHAQLCTGLRRHRARVGMPSPWEVNWLRNTPIQGSASVVFKVAGNRLYRRYQHYGAKLILALHDAYVFECPREHLETVGRITAEVMVGVVQEYYPRLNPRVDVNIEEPHCWNKGGKDRSLVLWLEDPELARKYLKS